MARLERISTQSTDQYVLSFRRSDDSIVDIAVSLGAGTEFIAQPDFLTVGKWRDVNDISRAILPAVQAFASAALVVVDE